MTLTRRTLLASSAFTFAFSFAAKAQAKPMNAYITIHADNSIIIKAPAPEMGQGINTTIPLIIAEELDADWAKVIIEQAPIHESFNHPIFRSQFVVASLSTRGYWQAVRIAAAQVRKLLVQAGALALEVRESELTTKDSHVIHAASGRKITYGLLAAHTTVRERLPDVKPEELKPASAFTLLGKDVTKHDVAGKTRGATQYSIDKTVANMLYGTVYHAPVLGSLAITHNREELLKMAGITHVFVVENGIAIVGKDYNSVLNARAKLKITWTDAKGSKFDSDDGLKANLAAVLGKELGVSVKNIGNAGEAFSTATSKIAASYTTDYTYHAQMEPLNALASVSSQDVEIWAGTQWPSMAVIEAAKIAGVTPDKVKFNPLPMGGGFGRRAYVDYILDAVRISKQVNAPVKVINSREEDVRNGRFRPMTAHHLEASLDAAGKVTAISHRISSDVVVPQLYGQARMDAQKNIDHIVTLGLDVSIYNIASHKVDHVLQDSGTRTAAYRGIGYGANSFAIESLIDELALNAKQDPLAFRLALLKDARGKVLLETAAKMADWGKKREGRALGLAIGKLGLANLGESMAATIAEISLDKTSGVIKVHQLWCAADCGIALQPRNSLAQIEGSLIWGLSSALKERVTLKNGEVQQSNFFDYDVLRMSETPRISIELVKSGAIPLPVGELGLSSVPPAIANAFRALTGKPIRALPMIESRVKSALI